MFYKIKISASSMLLILACSMGAFAAGDLIQTNFPAPQPAPEIQLPEIQKTTLSNGLSVWLVEHHELPQIALNLVIQAGSDHDPLNLPGVAALTADMLDEGTLNRTALEIANELQTYGASLGVESSFDGSFMRLETLTKYFDQTFKVFAEVLTKPNFPEKEFERLRKQYLTALLQQKDNPNAIADKVFFKMVYGSDHPYGNQASGTEASIKALTIEELRNFYSTFYRPNNATLLVVGDIKMDLLKEKLEHALKEWKKNEIEDFLIPPPPQIETAHIYLVDKPAAAQSEIRMGYPALARKTPDFFPVIIMNQVLGGLFTSRINMNLREKHGYTYGASSGFVFRKGVGPFIADAAVQTDKTDESMTELLKEISLMQKEGVTSDELTYVKKSLSGGFALNFETPSQVAMRLQNLVLYSLPEHYYRDYLQNIESVTQEDAHRVAKKHLNTSQMIIVVVGDLSKIRTDIEALNLGVVTILDSEAQPVK